MLLRQYNVADNVYQQKYPDLEPEIVEMMLEKRKKCVKRIWTMHTI